MNGQLGTIVDIVENKRQIDCIVVNFDDQSWCIDENLIFIFVAKIDFLICN